MKLLFTTLVGTLALTGCVSVTELNPEAQNVKTISSTQAEVCTFLDAISANNMNTLSKNPEADARARAFNSVASLGGNSLEITNSNLQVSSSGIGGTYFITGNAYSCGR